MANPNITGNSVTTATGAAIGCSCGCPKEPISAEALAVGMNFCCGREERHVNEIAALRNIVQRALINGERSNIIEGWNYYFPDKPLVNYQDTTPTDAVI